MENSKQKELVIYYTFNNGVLKTFGNFNSDKTIKYIVVFKYLRSRMPKGINEGVMNTLNKLFRATSKDYSDDFNFEYQVKKYQVKNKLPYELAVTKQLIKTIKYETRT